MAIIQFECAKGHQFNADDQDPPKVCPECDAWRQQSKRNRWIYKQQRKEQGILMRGGSINDRSKHCENDACKMPLKGYSHVDVDDATGEKSIICDNCGHHHPIEEPLNRWERRV